MSRFLYSSVFICVLLCSILNYSVLTQLKQLTVQAELTKVITS